MSVVAKNLVGMYTTTTGVDNLTLTAAVPKHITFTAAAIADADEVTYVIHDGNNSEIGRGVVGASGTTLTRATVLASTNSGNKISLSGSASVYVTLAVEDLLGIPGLVQPGSDQLLFWNSVTSQIEALDAASARTVSAAAPRTAKFLTAEADSELSAEVNLGLLSTGLLKLTVADGVATPSIAVAGADFVSPSAIVPLNKGGLGVALADPNADRLFFWDDSAGQADFLSLANGLSIVGTVLYGSANYKLRLFTASATYIPTSGCRSILFGVQGAGGGGGGAPVTASTTANAASGGASGSFALAVLDWQSILAAGTPSNVTIAVGAGGGGGSGAANGTAGAESSLSMTINSESHILTAPGGSPGAYMASAATANNVLGGTAGGLPSYQGQFFTSNALLPFYGNHGGHSYRTAATFFGSGVGGASIFGAGGKEIGILTSNGNPGLGYGAGGSGAAASVSNATVRVGGAGKGGLIFAVECF